jgi:hypothetical protein
VSTRPSIGPDAERENPLIGEPLALPDELAPERSILGAILLRNERLHEVTAIIDAMHFARPAHRLIFEAMVELNERGDAIDFITLKEALMRTAELEDVGGVAYITRLVDGVPQNSHAADYARIVKEKANLRALIATADTVKKHVRNGDQDLAYEAFTTGFAKLTGASTHDLQVARAAGQQRVQREARRIVDAEERGPQTPKRVRHRDLLSQPDIPTWVVDGSSTRRTPSCSPRPPASARPTSRSISPTASRRAGRGSAWTSPSGATWPGSPTRARPT